MEAEDVKPHMVSDAVGKYYAEHRMEGTEPETETRYIYRDIYASLGVDPGGRDRPAMRRIEANVRSALNRMFAAGTLHIVTGSRSNLYLTPEQYERRVAAEAEVSQHKALRLARVKAIKAELEELGLVPADGDGAIKLTLGDWEELVAMARNGKAVIR